MTAVKAKFDGNEIEVPPALRSAAPREVLIVFDEGGAASVAAPSVEGVSSIWDAFGRAPMPKDAAELDARLRADREGWDNR